MKGELVPVTGKILDERAAAPAIVTENGKAAAFAYAEFFGAAIESVHTYRAYRQAVDGFLSWCAARQVALQVVDNRIQGTVLVIGRAAKLHARHPSCLSCSVSSCTSRDLPMPGSPHRLRLGQKLRVFFKSVSSLFITSGRSEMIPLTPSLINFSSSSRGASLAVVQTGLPSWCTFFTSSEVA